MNNKWYLPGADDRTSLYDAQPEWLRTLFELDSGEVHELRLLIQRARREDVRSIRQLLHDSCAFTLNLATDRLPQLVAFLLTKEGME